MDLLSLICQLLFFKIINSVVCTPECLEYVLQSSETYHLLTLSALLLSGFSARVIAFFVLRSRLSQRRLRAWYHQLPEVEIEGGATA